MITKTKEEILAEWEEIASLDDSFRERFGSGLPLKMLPRNPESIKAAVAKCFAANRNMLAEIYQWEYSPDVQY